MAGESGAAGRSRLQLRLAAAWLALLAGGAALGKAGIGPFVWLETWFAVETGSLLGANVLLALLILGLPALWILLGAADRAEQAVGGDPARARRHAGRMALFLLALAGAGLAMALVAFVERSRLPDGREQPAELTAAMLAEGVPPDRRITATGAPVERARAAFMHGGRGTASRWAYTGFRPGATREQTAAEPAEALPIALFVERRELTAGPPMIRERLPQQETVRGYLVRDGLPPHARIVLERAGVRIASPHYLLRDGAAHRDGYATAILLGLILAAMMSAVAAMIWTIGALPIRGRRRN